MLVVPNGDESTVGGGILNILYNMRDGGFSKFNKIEYHP